MNVDYMKNIDCLIGMKDIPDKSIKSGRVPRP